MCFGHHDDKHANHTEQHRTPHKDEIALLEPFDRLGLDRITLVTTAAEADAYFASRARGSQVGAWASEQSRPLESRFALEKRVAEYAAKHVIGTVPRPPHWSGFRLQPNLIEFWQDGAFRLHDRLEYRRSAPSEPWTTRTLYP